MLKVEELSFSYGKKPLLKGLNFRVEKGENLAVIGESGSGKTTLLKLIYGEHDLNEGAIFWKDEQILGPKFNLVVGYDFMKYVSQEFDLMPYISVEENIGKFLSNFFPKEKSKRVQELLDVVELNDFKDTKVKNLSGGQKQRVALARALAKQPEIILLDEPFSHIDNFKKQPLRRKVFNYLKKHDITCLVATHDKNDVLGFADNILFLNNGTIEIMGAPDDLYHNPKTALIASFFNEYNIIDGQMVYASQLKVVDDSYLKVEVVKCYFNGNGYLIEALLNNKIILFESKKEFSKGAQVCLAINT